MNEQPPPEDIPSLMESSPRMTITGRTLIRHADSSTGWLVVVPTKETRPSLESEMSSLLNRFSAENLSDTPDFILAEYLMNCLDAYDVALKRRSDWYGRDAPAWKPHPITPWETQ